MGFVDVHAHDYLIRGLKYEETLWYRVLKNHHDDGNNHIALFWTRRIARSIGGTIFLTKLQIKYQNVILMFRKIDFTEKKKGK